MKAKVNSWHYNLMAWYKWSRKDPAHWSDEYEYRVWYSKNIGDYWGATTRDQQSFRNFKRFMTDTGTYQPVDFCTYWRNVLLWPLLFTAWWSVHLFLIFAALSFLNLVSVGASFGMIFGVAAVIALFAGACYAAEWIRDYLKSKKKVSEDDSPGFFSSVNKALKNPELCSMMEYEKDDTND